MMLLKMWGGYSPSVYTGACRIYFGASRQYAGGISRLVDNADCWKYYL